MDPYSVLGISDEADYEEAHRAYRQALRLLHPDKHAGSTPEDQDAATVRTDQIIQAWQAIEPGLPRSANPQPRSGTAATHEWREHERGTSTKPAKNPKETHKSGGNSTKSAMKPKGTSGSSARERYDSFVRKCEKSPGFWTVDQIHAMGIDFATQLNTPPTQSRNEVGLLICTIAEALTKQGHERTTAYAPINIGIEAPSPRRRLSRTPRSPKADLPITRTGPLPVVPGGYPVSEGYLLPALLGRSIFLSLDECSPMLPPYTKPWWSREGAISRQETVSLFPVETTKFLVPNQSIVHGFNRRRVNPYYYGMVEANCTLKEGLRMLDQDAFIIAWKRSIAESRFREWCILEVELWDKNAHWEDPRLLANYLYQVLGDVTGSSDLSWV